MRLIDFVTNITNEYIEGMPKSQRKKYGQFFTSKETAIFMAELFTIPKNKSHLNIIDAGSGTGLLSAALIERLESIDSIRTINLVCYENDPNIISILKYNLEWISKNTSLELNYEIKDKNYILSQRDEYNGNIDTNKKIMKFDMVISNPPYMKIPKDAEEAKSMPDICYGTPNLYFLFTAMGLFNLKENGELVFIIPRSWTSGAYFTKFRKKLLNYGRLKHIHLFLSRNKVFDKENVLQETIIIKVKKSIEKANKITITTTNSNIDFSDKTIFTVPYDIVISGENRYVFLVTDQNDVKILAKIDKLEHTLPSIGLKMKTGLTVDFRNKQYLSDNSSNKAVPLFYSQHIQDGFVKFPIGKKNEYINTVKPGLIQNNTNYLFVKRFTSKEENRRLQCGIYLSKSQPAYSKISTQNKINFIDSDINELSINTVYGLYVLFNSTLYDRYYRILNGSTQVNSTEINSIPVPSLEDINMLGNKLIEIGDITEISCDSILGSFINGKN